MPQDLVQIRPRESDLKEKWKGVNDLIPVNTPQYAFDSPERLKAFVDAQFPTEEEQVRYKAYRKEWYRRPKEFDPGPQPLSVVTELVSTCNLGCTMCYTITEEFQNTVVGAQRMLPWPIVTAIIDECVEMDVPSLLFSWRGESSMYRSRHEGKVYLFEDVLKYARDAGILEITCLTHGQLIDDKKAEAIVEAQPSWISISLDGLGDTYNKIRTPPNKKNSSYNAFETVTNNIKRICEIRDAKGYTRPQIRTNSVYPAIANDPTAYRDHMISIGVGWVTVNELLDFRGEHMPQECIIDDWACHYPFQRLSVSANGIVTPCTGAHNEEPGLVLGRYRGTPPKQVKNPDGSVSTIAVPEVTFADAWMGEKLENIRELHKTNQRQTITPGCRNCRHGAVKNGVEWLPDDWDMEAMEWKDRMWRE